jgi:general stress protein 26
MSETLDDFYEMVEDLDTAMFTTRRPDGRLVSRPMANQARAEGADLWFVTSDDSEKIDEINFDPQVNLAYYKDGTREWVSVSGKATLSRDRARIRELYRPDWKIYFEDEGGAKDGSEDDPRFVLIGVDIESAMFMEVTRPKPVVLFGLARGFVTGAKPDIAETHLLTEDDIREGRVKGSEGERG